MIRIFETGDLHIGRSYADRNRHPKGKELAEKRLEALTDLVEFANREECDLFAVTGDLFDTLNISRKKIIGVAETLSNFRGTVVILPGNHDYYPKDSDPELWREFLKACDGNENIILLNRFEKYDLEIGNDSVEIYPAYCHSARSETNNLGWIREQEISRDSVYKIGIAHGAVEGYTIDNEGTYFLMTEQELKEIPMDVWLIGHTHVMFPNNLTAAYSECGRILNAGTHVQTDIRNNTDGNCFIIEVSKDETGISKVRAKRFVSGNIFFRHFDVHVKPDSSGNELRNAIEKAIAGVPQNASVSLSVSGAITRDEYAQRSSIYNECLKGFFEHSDIDDAKLTQLIDKDFITGCFGEESFPAQLLLKLVDDPQEAQMAYELLISKDCQL